MRGRDTHRDLAHVRRGSTHPTYSLTTYRLLQPSARERQLSSLFIAVTTPSIKTS